jgi:hypothetical protein
LAGSYPIVAHLLGLSTLEEDLTCTEFTLPGQNIQVLKVEEK